MSDATASTKAIAIRLPALNQQIEISAAWVERREAVLAESRAIASVAGQEQFEAATQALQSVTKLGTSIENTRKKLSKPFRDCATAIKKVVDAETEPLAHEKGRLKDMLREYATEQERKRRAEQARREEEARREAERQLAEQQAQQEAADELGIDEPTSEPAVDLSQMAPAAPLVMPARSDHARVQTRIKWAVDDPASVPRAFMMVDDRKVNAYVRENRERVAEKIANDQIVIPGIAFTEEIDVQGR